MVIRTLRDVRPTFVSLFAGVGGFDLGLERAGWRCVAQVEVDKFANEVLAEHWPDVPRFNDVTEVSGADLEKAAGGRPTLICGGFPCQGISLAGKRKGFQDERSKLWWEFHRILEEAQPQYCLIENVQGLLSSGGGRDLGAILGSLGELGYGFAYRVLDSRFFGVPQRRRRIFVVGCLDHWGHPGEVLLERALGGWDLDPGRASGEEAARAVAVGADGEGIGRHARGVGRGRRAGEAEEGDPPTASYAFDHRVGEGKTSPRPPTQNLWVEETQTLRTVGPGSVVHVVTPSGPNELSARETDEAETLTAIGANRRQDRGTLVTAPLAALHTMEMYVGGDGEQRVRAVEISPTLDARARNGVRQKQMALAIIHSYSFDADTSVTTGMANRSQPVWKEESQTIKGNSRPPAVLHPFLVPFRKRGRARSKTDAETWGDGDVANTLNTFDDGGDMRATHAIVSIQMAEGADPTVVRTLTSKMNRFDGEVDTFLTVLAEQGSAVIDGVEVALVEMAVRRLMPIECERLQGFPDRWTVQGADGKEISDTQRYKQMGNAVTTNVVFRIGAGLREVWERDVEA
jgi:DNA (cytosine-5)-methyltransferase 1